MAIVHLHLVSLPYFFSTKNPLFINPITPPPKSLHSSTTPISLSPPLPFLPLSKTRKPKSFLLLASASPTETPEIEFEDEEEDGDEGSRTRVLAQNVPWSSTADDIRPLFEQFGTVVDIELSMYNKIRNRGLAFVTMGSYKEALAALSNLESSEFEGRTLKLAWAKPRKKKQPPSIPPKLAPIHNLFVANLPFQARANDLKEFFNSDNGNAASAEIIFYDNPRRSAGYGFVSFYTKKEAEAALLAFQGKEFMGREIRVARSKRFLRQGTKESIQAEIESTKLRSDTEQSEIVN